MGNRFVDNDASVIYLDGNSLGRLPGGTMNALQEVVSRQWGARLIEGWDEWMDLPRRIGDLLASELLGAPGGSVVVSDSTTVNLYKLAAGALSARPGRQTIVTDTTNFPPTVT